MQVPQDTNGIFLFGLQTLVKAGTNGQNSDTKINKTVVLDLTTILKSSHNHNSVFKWRKIDNFVYFVDVLCLK